IVGRDVLDFPGFDVENREILVEARMRFTDDQTVVIRRKSRNSEPTGSFVKEGRFLGRPVTFLHVDVEHRLVAAVRGEGKALAVVAPAAPPVFRASSASARLVAARSAATVFCPASIPIFPVGERRYGAVFEAKELGALVAAGVHPEDQFLALGREGSERYPLVEEGALVGPRAGFGERPNLGGCRSYRGGRRVHRPGKRTRRRRCGR